VTRNHLKDIAEKLCQLFSDFNKMPPGTWTITMPDPKVAAGVGVVPMTNEETGAVWSALVVSYRSGDVYMLGAWEEVEKAVAALKHYLSARTFRESVRPDDLKGLVKLLKDGATLDEMLTGVEQWFSTQFGPDAAADPKAFVDAIAEVESQKAAGKLVTH
jgi:hypothetical protein